VSRHRGRDERGETLPLLIIWPTLLVAIMLLALHAFILSNAQAEAAVAASQGLRAAWRAAAESDLTSVAISDEYANFPDLKERAIPAEVIRMSTQAKAAVAASAADDRQSWRWWHNDVVKVQSDWCVPLEKFKDSGADAVPGPAHSGWVRVTVSGKVLGPLAALWPDRFDRVYAVAEGPARFITSPDAPAGGPRSTLPECP